MVKSKIVVYLVIVIFVIFSISPIYYTIITSLKSDTTLFENPMGLPSTLFFKNYIDVWFEGNFRYYFLNSIVITVPTVCIVVFCCLLAAYAFSKLIFPGKKFLMSMYAIGIALSVPSLVVSLFMNLKNLNLINNFLGVILPEAALQLPFGILIFTAFLGSIPNELLDAARVDGANEFQILFKILLPLVKPGLQSLAIISFMFTWHDYLLPLVVMQETGTKPLTVGLLVYMGRYMIDYPRLSAASLIILVPVVILCLIAQKALRRGFGTMVLKG